MPVIVDLIDRVLMNPDDEANLEAVATEVRALMHNRPLFSW
jgi:glycine hydroxymethyltransferase